MTVSGDCNLIFYSYIIFTLGDDKNTDVQKFVKEYLVNTLYFN